MKETENIQTYVLLDSIPRGTRLMEEFKREPFMESKIVIQVYIPLFSPVFVDLSVRYECLSFLGITLLPV